MTTDSESIRGLHKKFIRNAAQVDPSQPRIAKLVRRDNTQLVFEEGNHAIEILRVSRTRMKLGTVLVEDMLALDRLKLRYASDQDQNWPGEKHNSRCVKAASASSARIKCEADCGGRNATLSDLCVAPGCEIDAPINCDLNPQVDPDDTPHLLSEKDSEWKCDPDGDVIPVWGGESEFVSFSASGALVLNDGTSASILGVRGYIGFELTKCKKNSCDVAIDALEAFSGNAFGFVTDASGNTVPYSLEGFGFRGANVVKGKWHKKRGTITFEEDIVEAQYWGDLLTYGDIEVFPGTQAIEIDQIVGYLPDDEGPLTLNLAYNTPLGTATVSLTTRAE